MRRLAPLGPPAGNPGHAVRLVLLQYVKLFVRRGKNDRNDAEAISAAARPEMPSVAVKPAERQAEAIVLSPREWLVRQRAASKAGHMTTVAPPSEPAHPRGRPYMRAVACSWAT